MALVELVGGALLGVAIGELFKAVIDAKQKASSFQPSLTRLESTLRTIIPRLDEISRLNDQLNHPEMEELVALLNNGKALVLKCSKISTINFVRKVQYSNELLELDNSLLRYFVTVLPLDHFKDTKEILLRVKKMESLQMKLVGGSYKDIGGVCSNHSESAAGTSKNGSNFDRVECRQEGKLDENQWGNSNNCLQSSTDSERNRNGGWVIKIIGGLNLAPPPVIVRQVVVDNVSSTWDIFRSLGPDDNEGSESDSDLDDSSMIVQCDSISLQSDDTDRIVQCDSISLHSDDRSMIVQCDSISLHSDDRIVRRCDRISLDSDDSSMIVQYGSSISLDVSAAGTSKNGKFRHIIKSWKKGAFLGSGTFGSVYEGYTDSGFFFAVMEVPLLDPGSQGLPVIYQIEQEISFLSQFEHENIVQYLGTEKDEARFYIFSDLVAKGSLEKLYQKYTLRESQVSAYTRQILNGLKYLHERYVIHRDIKCANILVHANGSVKLADFGLAKATNLNDINYCKGTAFWMAPEVVNRKKNGYGIAADIWSLGCTVLEMLTRKIPYFPLKQMQALFRIDNGQPPPVPDSLSREARHFINICLQVNPDNRPTAAQLLEHSFVMRSLQDNSSPASAHYFAAQHRSGSTFMI